MSDASFTSRNQRGMTNNAAVLCLKHITNLFPAAGADDMAEIDCMG